MLSDIDKITIGSDPEFILVKESQLTLSGELVPAYKLCPRDARIHIARIGCDGAIATGELRPKQAADPIQHYRNIKRLIIQSRRRLLRDRWIKIKGNIKLQMRAGSTGALQRPLGGHIHFGGVPPPLIREVVALDRYVSLPLVFVEQMPHNVLRRNAQFGKLGNVRSQPWGFEYRTPASWIIDPNVTIGVLCLAYITICETILYPRKIPVDRGFEEFSFNKSERKILEGELLKAIEEIKSMELYSKYKKYIDPFLQRAKGSQEWDETKDVWENWIAPKEQQCRS